MGIYHFERAKQDSDWTWQTFGRELLISGDIDPVYIMLAESASLDENALMRYLLSYFCFYHTGVAARAAEAPSNQFYDILLQAVRDKWPRGMERRHFYGKTALNCIAGLEDFGEPEQVVDAMTYHLDFAAAKSAIESFNGFGPWMSWKVADMAERILLQPIDFSDTTLSIYKDPVQGAAMIVHGDWRADITEQELQQVVDDQVAEFADLLAPPFYDRLINIQEVETNLCKFKAHYKHHYPIGNDTYHIRQALEGWGDLAQDLLRWAPQIKPGGKGYD